MGVGGFNRIAVAARGAGMSTSDAREVWAAASEASATFQLSADKSNLIMLAFSQMMSKGKVSAEELNRQMSEQLPIAMQAAEMATGKTAGEIFKLMENGKLMSKDFVLPFARAMRSIVRENDALATAQDKMASHQYRLTNSLKLMVDEVFQNKAAKVFGTIFKRLTEFVAFTKPAIVGLMNGLFEVVDMVVETTSAIGGLIAAVVGLAGGGDMIQSGWSYLKIFFHGLVGTIWEVISAVQFLEDLFKGNLDMNDIASNWGNAFSFDNIKSLLEGNGNAPSTGTSIRVDKVEINNPTDADDVINRLMGDVSF